MLNADVSHSGTSSNPASCWCTWEADNDDASLGVPATHVGDAEVQYALSPVVVGIWKVNSRWKNSLSLYTFQIHIISSIFKFESGQIKASSGTGAVA